MQIELRVGDGDIGIPQSSPDRHQEIGPILLYIPRVDTPDGDFEDDARVGHLDECDRGF